MISKEEIQTQLGFLGKDLVSKILSISSTHEVKSETEILKEGQYITSIPIVIKGLLKVFTRHEDKELLLYYIQSSESCIMSFSASLSQGKSSIFAKTIEDSIILLIPADKVTELTQNFPAFNALFHQQYKLRYSDLLDTINHLVFSHLDERLYRFLKETSRIKKENPLKISHRQIAVELGTAREVISRVMKKLEKEQKIEPKGDRIHIL
jgi:CRP/FNR family transcriptional regulator